MKTASVLTIGLLVLILGALVYFLSTNADFRTGSSGGIRPEAEEYMEPNTVVIEKFGLKVPIIRVEEATQEAFTEAMRHGVGHYPGTAQIGEYGNAFLFGHSSPAPWSTNDYETIFTPIARLEIGEEIRASDGTGRMFKYRVIEKYVVSPDALGPLDQREHKRRLLTLQTSWPPGRSLQRYIVTAEI